MAEEEKSHLLPPPAAAVLALHSLTKGVYLGEACVMGPSSESRSPASAANIRLLLQFDSCRKRCLVVAAQLELASVLRQQQTKHAILLVSPVAQREETSLFAL